MSNLKTVLHAFYFDTRKPAENDAYKKLVASLTAEGLKCFETWGGGTHWLQNLDGLTVDLELAHLFNNQWNTAPIPGHSDKGLRVFDWAMDARPEAPAGIKRGHWLEQTAEMREVRRNTVGCGYCGKQEPAAKGYVFCPHCLDSEYLTEETLHLTRMVPIEDSDKNRAPLSEAERGHLLPQFRDAQLHGTTERGKARLAKARGDVAEKYRKAIHAATTERDGFTWLMDHGLNTENVIYYSHTGKFSFGWRAPISESVASSLLDVLTEFPFEYEIKRA